MSLREMLDLLKRNLPIIIILPILAALLVGVYCWKAMPDIYTANVTMYVLSKDENTNTTVTSTDLSVSEKLAADIEKVATSEQVKSRTATALNITSLTGYTISTEGSSGRVVTLKVQGEDSAGVAKVANQIAAVLASLSSELMDLKGINIVDSAVQPSLPSGPNRLMYTACAFLVGLALALAIVVIRDSLDTTVKSREEAEEDFGLPVLGKMTTAKR